LPLAVHHSRGQARFMQVLFYKEDGGRLCAWVAVPPKRRRFQGTTMASGRDLPHDLATFVVEAALGLDRGFWNLVANGATFKSIGLRQTTPGRDRIRAYRAELTDAESTVNAHVAAWRSGKPTPVGPPFATMLAEWRALSIGGQLALVWPTRRLPPSLHGRHGRPGTSAPS
jgi:hypothetical protein